MLKHKHLLKYYVQLLLILAACFGRYCPSSGHNITSVCVELLNNRIHLSSYEIKWMALWFFTLIVLFNNSTQTRCSQKHYVIYTKLPQVIKIGSIVTMCENNIALVFEIGFE
jgi:hypothetical protein